MNAVDKLVASGCVHEMEFFLVPEGKTLEKDIVMNEGVELQEVQVKGAFQGQKKAINTQKNNLGITNVVSANQVGKFPN